MDYVRNIFGSGLPQEAKEAQLKEHFGQFGVIETVTLKTDMATGQSRGFCFIVYKSVDSLEAAVAGEIERVTLKTDMATGRSRGSFAKRAANAFLLGLASLLPTPASGSDDGYDPITNLIR